MSTQNCWARSWSPTSWSRRSPARDSDEPHDARRRYYRLTPLGREAASRETALLARLVDVAAAAGLLGNRESA
ncbi:hypothetical protein [Actinophytocola sp.]|uniref:hypothetical protein n=1 Tax=Actinophytocola sp. TaxID=1872138 RepID=UPI0025BBACCC|nr:hypothetical protein [Actinophytocola sp.]